MSVDPLMASLSKVDGEMSTETIDALEAAAVVFLRSGGVLGFSEWSALSWTSREAFERAGAKVWSERAAAIACYLADPAEAVRVIKGDDAVVEAALKAVGDPK